MMIINSYAYATGGGGGGPDVIPDALNASYNATREGASIANAYFQINGIDTTINLKINYNNYNVYSFKIYYIVADTVGSYSSDPIESYGTPIAPGETFSVTNGKYVIIGCGDATESLSDTVTVLNNSDSDTLLTTIYTTFTAAGGGGAPE